MSAINPILPGVEAVKRVQLRAADVIVIECDRMLSQVEQGNLTGLVESIWPGHRVTVWPPGYRMSVVSPQRAPSSGVVQDVSGVVHVAQD